MSTCLERCLEGWWCLGHIDDGGVQRSTAACVSGVEGSQCVVD